MSTEASGYGFSGQVELTHIARYSAVRPAPIDHQADMSIQSLYAGDTRSVYLVSQATSVPAGLGASHWRTRGNVKLYCSLKRKASLERPTQKAAMLISISSAFALRPLSSTHSQIRLQSTRFCIVIITMADHTGSMHEPTWGFCKLPAELRNSIYQLSFESSIFDIRSGSPLKVPSGLNAHVHDHVRAPGILLANKQTYMEGIDYYYELSGFASGWVTDLGNWLHGLSRQRERQLRRLRFLNFDAQLFPLTLEERESLAVEPFVLLVSIKTYLESIGVALRDCTLETGHRFGRPNEVCTPTVLNTSDGHVSAGAAVLMSLASGMGHFQRP